MTEYPGRKPALPPRETDRRVGDDRPAAPLYADGVVIGPPDMVCHAPEQEFLAAVEESRDGPLIRYSKRLELLELADRLKIGQFRANLLIAEAQRRTGGIVPKVLANREEIAPAADEGWRDRFFLAAAFFIVCALVNLVLTRFFFRG